MRKARPREFNVVVERDEDGYYGASVPALPGCHAQARPLDKLMERIGETIQLCLEVEREVQTTGLSASNAAPSSLADHFDFRPVGGLE